MRILVAEDDPVSRRLLESALKRWGHEPLVACDGDRAWEELTRPGAPRLAILDWMMPGRDGIDLCRAVRALAPASATYIVLLTARHAKADIVAGLEAGADDYLTKPFDQGELRARIRAGVRVVELEMELERRVRDLEEALARVKQLQGLLPICSYCKKIRDDRDYWQQVEVYLAERSSAQFSHGICPDCFERVVKPQLRQFESGDSEG